MSLAWPSPAFVLTEAGVALLPALQQIGRWAEEYLPDGTPPADR